MDEAKRWLNEEVSQSADKRLKSALELFTSLETLTSCNRHSFDIVEANDFLTGNKARNFGENSVETSRVLRIVAHYGMQHAAACIENYGQKIHQMYNKIGGLNTERVHKIADNLIWQPIENSGKILHDVIEQLADGSHDRKYLERGPNVRGAGATLEESKLSELYNSYLVQPCAQFLGINNGRLLDAIQYYSQWVQPSDELLSKLPYRFRICDRLVNTDNQALYKMFVDEAMLQQ